MAFDPTLPANHSPIVSAELRNQFNGLKSLIDAQAAQIAAMQNTPFIVRFDGSHFSILWRGSLPVDWAVQSQGEEGGIWDINTVVAGDVMLVGVSGSPYAVRMVGRDAGHNPVTDVSNVLILNPPTSNIVASYDEGHDELTWTFDGPAPDLWHIEYSVDGGATWPNSEDLPGTSTNESPSFEPSKVQIYAKSNTSGVFGEPSNVVSVLGG